MSLDSALSFNYTSTTPNFATDTSAAPMATDTSSVEVIQGGPEKDKANSWFIKGPMGMGL